LAVCVDTTVLIHVPKTLLDFKLRVWL